jgi:gas vesicle protein
MAFELLPVNYTDAVWSGLKRYNLINNEDGTVSFQDVTAYSNRDSSFFGAKDANRMNEALNTIMSMVENGTDLYTAFQNYFAAQKTEFEENADKTQSDLNSYVQDLKTEGDGVIESIKTDYRTEVNEFEDNQEELFNTWFNLIKGQLGEDAAGNLQNQIIEISNRMKTVPDFKIDTITIESTQWVSVSEDCYAYDFTYALDDNAKVDIQLTAADIAIVRDSGATAMYAENMTNNRIRIYCMGKPPYATIDVQFSVTGIPTVQ